MAVRSETVRRALVAVLAGAVAAGCATTPRKTVAGLDAGDRKWKSRECVAARKAAADFDEQKDGRAAIAVVGNLIVPFAGAATAFAMDRVRDRERERLNHRIRAACVSDPLKDKRRVARR